MEPKQPGQPQPILKREEGALRRRDATNKRVQIVEPMKEEVRTSLSDVAAADGPAGTRGCEAGKYSNDRTPQEEEGGGAPPPPPRTKVTIVANLPLEKSGRAIFGIQNLGPRPRDAFEGGGPAYAQLRLPNGKCQLQ